MDIVDWPYHPSPFVRRTDCQDRVNAILSYTGDPKDFSVLDIGCAEGYFGFSFLLRRAKECVFVEKENKRLDVVRKMGEAFYPGRFTALNDYTGVDHKKVFSLTIVLDIWTPKLWPNVELLSQRTDRLIISCGDTGDLHNKALKDELSQYYRQVNELHTGLQNRKIFGCRI